jgi:1-acyl-sn-glycerol-3-phosphate acyltransferase
VSSPSTYDDALARGRRINAGLRIGRPGRSRAWPVITPFFAALRTRMSIDVAGAEQVAPGAAILVSNHKSTWDPVVTVMATGWRVSAFTKAEWYEGPAAPFFSLLGQIPLRRGDEESTEWALDMATRTLDHGVKVGIYPEGTRGPDDDALYRLHQRVLVPLITGNPEVPVHAISVRYSPRGRRTLARIRISPRLPLDTRSMSGQEITDVIRASIAESGHLEYVDQYAFVVKARLQRQRDAAGEGRPGATE